MSVRPRIALIGRFTNTASALRYGGVVSSRALLESLWDAGADPITLLAAAESDWKQRLQGYQGVLLAGAGISIPLVMAKSRTQVFTMLTIYRMNQILG